MASIRSGRLLSTSTRCANCQRQVLTAFISSIGHPTVTFRTRPQPTQPQPQRRGFVASRFLRSDANQPPEAPESAADAQPEPAPRQTDQPQDDDPLESSTVDSKPWYLQVQEGQYDQTEEANPFAHRQKLPPLPQDPPPILQPLLQHLSVDIGLDYLTILDLRKLDPPPALGSSLIMIFGSARSEKHLHVSGDRLCRWLRTHYKLSPYADGLLGRNELKLKLRRKARRMKMLNAVGAADPSDPDDGTRTGWICVNAGIVPLDQSEQAETLEQDDDFVGFGRRSDGVNVVVQMLTEEKRGELDLEGLWQGILRRSLKQQAAVAEPQDTVDEIPTPYRPGRNAQGRKRLSERNRAADTIFSHGSTPYPRQHVRGLHTSVHLRNTDSPVVRTVSPENMFEDAEAVEEMPLEAASPRGAVQTSVRMPPLPPVAGLASTEALPVLLDYLKGLEPRIAVTALGSGQDDRDSTPFLRAFYSALPPFFTIPDYTSTLSLHAHALKISHPHYTKVGFLEKFREMNASGQPVPASVFHLAVYTILLTPHDHKDARQVSPRAWMRRDLHFDKRDGDDPLPDRTAHHALKRSLGMAFEVLETMESHGHNAAAEPVLRALHAAISTPDFAPNTPPPQDSFIRLQQYRFSQALDLLLPHTAPSDTLTTTMLRTYATQGHWRNFWQAWRARGRHGLPHTPDMYAVMFRGVADAGHMGHAREVLGEWAPQMRRQKPPVDVTGDVAISVAHCLDVAGYSAESEDGRWAELWGQCRRALELMQAEELEGPEGS